MKSALYHLHTITSLHVGIGQGTGVIDMPIARERASNLPQIPGSGVKGVLRDELSDDTNDDMLALFGPKMGSNASEYAGAIKVGDARLLALPIRSWNGTFAWVSCPMILRRYARDLSANQNGGIPNIPSLNAEQALPASDSELIGHNNKVYLEDLDLVALANNDVDGWAEDIANRVFNKAWKDIFKQRFLVVHDNVFGFLSETATEIRARIKIDETTGTVQQGALWYEEYLPAESLLWGVVAVDNPKGKGAKNKAELFALLPSDKRLQIGGNATVGAGQTRWILADSLSEQASTKQGG